MEKTQTFDHTANSAKRVIIIGAGISGLAAAKMLTESDPSLDVTVLEASGRIGGRISSNREFGFTFEEGASWIHGDLENPIDALAQQASAKTFITSLEAFKIYDLGGKEVDSSVLYCSGSTKTVSRNSGSLSCARVFVSSSNLGISAFRM